jgi:hypothetical protein
MAKIRISKNDEQEYKRLVRNAKSKMRRLQKQHGIDLTDEISLPSLSSFQNRKEFNNFKEDINKFNKGLKNDYKIVKNEKGESFTKKKVKEYEKKEKEAIRLAKEHYEHTTAEQQKIFLKPNNLDIPRVIPWKDLSKKDFNQRLENLTKRSDPQFFNERDERFKENYIKTIQGSFNENSMVASIVEMLEDIPADYLIQVYKENLALFDFEQFDSEGQEVDADMQDLEKIHQILLDYSADDYLLKNFPDKV